MSNLSARFLSPLFIIVFVASISICGGCTKVSGLKNVQLRNRQVIFKNTEDSVFTIFPGKALNIPVDFGEKDFPVKQTLRITGYGVFPEPYSRRGDLGSYKEYVSQIDDYLDSKVTYNETYSLVFMGNGEKIERNAFYRLSEDELNPFKGKKTRVDIPVKTSNLSVSEGGYLMLELQMYLKKSGIHPDDIYDKADLIEQIQIPANSPDWSIISKEVVIPGNIVCILFRLGSKDISGQCNFGTPAIASGKSFLKLLPFQTYSKGKKNWIGENLSNKEWPEFEINVNGKSVFEGKVFDRSSNVSDFEIDLPESFEGKSVLDIRLKDGFPARFPYAVKTVELLEKSARSFELMAIPKFVSAGKKFGVLVEINQPATLLSIKTSKNISSADDKKRFEEPGYYSLSFTAGEPGLNEFIIISDGKRSSKFEIGQIISKKDDSVFISTSDDIYVDKDVRRFSDYLTWYINEGIGNAFVWRPQEQWNHYKASPEYYKITRQIFKDLQIPYSLIIEARCNENPKEKWLDDPLFMGKQSHENDGAYYYWGHPGLKWLYTDLVAKYGWQNGVNAKNRPVRTKNGDYIFFDPNKVKNMEEGVEYFLNNLKGAKGESTRHTGPSTLFRYFFMAGYDWVGAELMYGPEEVIMSSVRGACKAYGKTDYGTHLASQWASGPFDAPNHSARLFLSLAVSYMHGATHLNTEDGLWNTEVGIDRFSLAGQQHIKAQRDMLHFIQTHERRGSLVTPVAILQGYNDGWKCFGRDNIWAQSGEEWKFGPAEESFDLLKVFYPGNKLETIYKFPLALSPQGWYTATPYGLIDLLPVEAPSDVLQKYKAVAFLGWNTFRDEDFKRLTIFVKNGGTLLLTGAHLNTVLLHNKQVIIPEKNDVLKELLGNNYETASKPYENIVGKGKVIFFPEKKYPIDASLREQYTNTLKQIGTEAIANEKEKGWIDSSPDIEFAAWDWKDNQHRTIYLLNTDWWSDTTVHQAALVLGNSRFQVDVRRNFLETITISGGIAVMAESMTTDIMSIDLKAEKCNLTVQTTGSDHLKIYVKGIDEIRDIDIVEPGIHKIEVPLSKSTTR